ncbi:MAG: ester cyclase [Streptosporangiaceae bacterium]
MYVRMYTLAGDPARLGDATSYLEDKVKPQVEAQLGSRGMAVFSHADLGVCLICAYWDSADAMTASDRAVAVPHNEVAELIGGTVSAEHYEVPVFIRQARPGPGAGVRLSRINGQPDLMSQAIEEFRHRAGPALLDMPGLCSGQFLVQRDTGHSIVLTTWEDMDVMASVRAQVAALRTRMAALTKAQVRTVEEYMLSFSSVREGDNISLIEREVTLWNDRDQAGWLALADLNRFGVTAPGGLQLSGREAADTLWDVWNGAFPDNRLTTVSIHGDDRGGVHEGRFIGTHSGYLRRHAGDVGPTGRMVDIRFAVVHECEDGKITSTHLYYDEGDLLAQLGVPLAAEGTG